MIHLIILNHKIFIDEFTSIYSLKHQILLKLNIPINNQILLFKNKLLQDDKSPYFYQMTDGDKIDLQIGSSGGDSFSIILFLLYIIFIILYLILILSGLIPILSYAYTYLLEWLTKKFNVSNYYILTFIWIILFILKIFIIYFFVYTISSYILFPLIYYFYNNLCKTLNIANTFGFIMAITYIIIYGLFSIPDEILNFATYLGDLTLYTQLITTPFLSLIQEFVNYGKYAGIYAIPFLGTPFISGYHTAINLLVIILKEGIDFIANYNCDDQEMIENMGKMILNWDKITVLKDWVKSYHLENIMKILPISMIPEINEYYKCEVDNLPFWEKYNPFNEKASEYYASQYALKGFCLGLNLVRFLSGLFDSMGGSMQIANMIKTGNIAGFLTILLAPIIALIMWFAGYL